LPAQLEPNLLGIDPGANKLLRGSILELLEAKIFQQDLRKRCAKLILKQLVKMT
jgi:hypothetical protein